MGTTQYVALLRAINVGGRVVKMAELIRVFERLQLDDITTFIASGNVIFRSGRARTRLAPDIEAALQEALGYPVVTMLRTARDIAIVAAADPFRAVAAPGAALYVGFLRDRPTAAAVERTLALQTPDDSLHVEGREVYWLARKNMARASITGAHIERAIQTPVTFRNVTTVRRLAARYPA